MRLVTLLSIALTAARTVSAQGEQAATTKATTIAGVVFDSLAMQGLVGATVQIADATGKTWSKSTETDATGHFEFGAVPGGYGWVFVPCSSALRNTQPINRLRCRSSIPLPASRMQAA